MKFNPGDRVRISANYPWAKGAYGTITEPPETIRRPWPHTTPWEGLHRFVQGVHGPVEIYFVTFDEPQVDDDGDGPYKGTEIEARALEFVTEP